MEVLLLLMKERKVHFNKIKERLNMPSKTLSVTLKDLLDKKIVVRRYEYDTIIKKSHKGKKVFYALNSEFYRTQQHFEDVQAVFEMDRQKLLDNIKHLKTLDRKELADLEFDLVGELQVMKFHVMMAYALLLADPVNGAVYYVQTLQRVDDGVQEMHDVFAEKNLVKFWSRVRIAAGCSIMMEALKSRKSLEAVVQAKLRKKSRVRYNKKTPIGNK